MTFYVIRILVYARKKQDDFFYETIKLQGYSDDDYFFVVKEIRHAETIIFLYLLYLFIDFAIMEPYP
jgi:hypothetical protein